MADSDALQPGIEGKATLVAGPGNLASEGVNEPRL
jgi:hypothetical protein